MRVYVAGPMTGIPQFNFPAFDSATERLRKAGYAVVSPAELDNQDTRNAALASVDGAPGSGTTNGETWGDFLARDVKLVADEVDAIAVLPGWDNSRGARLEVFTARLCDKPVFDFTAWNECPTRADLTSFVLAEAPKSATGEVRTISATGGEKGVKPERMDLIPPEFLQMVARVYGMGAEKYEAHNWAKGYEWSKSYGAMLRHLMSWASGEDTDPESGESHLGHAAWHCATLFMFDHHGLGTDDRLRLNGES